MAVLFVVLVGASLRHVFRHHFEDNIRPHLVQYLEYVQQDIGRPPDRQRAQKIADKLKIGIHIIDDQGTWSSRSPDVELNEVEIERRFIEKGVEYLFVEHHGRDYLMTRTEGATLLFNVPHIRQERRGLRGFVPLGVLLIILLVLYHATRRLFSPIETIQAGVKRFGNGELDHRIEVNRRDELGELANSFNAMADDIEQMLDAKRQLLLAISHELRTPLTRAKVATELLNDEDRKAQIHQDLNSMETLIEELIEAERLSTRHSVLNKISCDLNALISDVKDAFGKDAPVEFVLPESLNPLQLDAARIGLLLKNLIENALCHTPDDANSPQVILVDKERDVTIQVKDYGFGIEARHLPHLTEPFYRVDPSRQRETGGYGLGLYLCRMIAEAHGGKLTIDSDVGKGTTVSVGLPK